MSEERKKSDLYGQAGTPIFEELWLMCNADAHCTLGREGECPHKHRILCLIFSCPALKYKFYFIKYIPKSRFIRFQIEIMAIPINKFAAVTFF